MFYIAIAGVCVVFGALAMFFIANARKSTGECSGVNRSDVLLNFQ
jgi:hypothetical protein